MKKKTLLSVAVAVMLVAAMAVTAFAASQPITMSGPSTVQAGETFQVTFSGAAEGYSANISVSGATIDSVGGGLSSASTVVLLSGMPATYTMTAGQSGTVSISLSNIEMSNGESTPTTIPNQSFSINIAGGDQPTQQPSTTPTEQPSQQPSTQPTGSDSPTASASASSSATTGGNTGSNGGSTGGTTNSNQDRMPKTGDATMDLWVLAVIAAGCAGAAVVAGKKVFSK